MYSQTPGLGRTANATHGGRTMASYILPKKKKVQQNQHQTNKTILKLAQAKTECDLLFCVTNLSGSQNFAKGPIQKCLPVSFRDCFYLSNQLMVLQNSFSLAFNPTIPHVIIMFNNLTKHFIKIITIFFFFDTPHMNMITKFTTYTKTKWKKT